MQVSFDEQQYLGIAICSEETIVAKENSDFLVISDRQVLVPGDVVLVHVLSKLFLILCNALLAALF